MPRGRPSSSASPCNVVPSLSLPASWLVCASGDATPHAASSAFGGSRSGDVLPRRNRPASSPSSCGTHPWDEHRRRRTGNIGGDGGGSDSSSQHRPGSEGGAGTGTNAKKGFTSSMSNPPPAQLPAFDVGGLVVEKSLSASMSSGPEESSFNQCSSSSSSACCCRVCSCGRKPRVKRHSVDAPRLGETPHGEGVLPPPPDRFVLGTARAARIAAGVGGSPRKALTAPSATSSTPSAPARRNATCSARRWPNRRVKVVGLEPMAGDAAACGSSSPSPSPLWLVGGAGCARATNMPWPLPQSKTSTLIASRSRAGMASWNVSRMACSMVMSTTGLARNLA
mmetsp:Transcript_102525/g.296509  ORF Transcript_102525/g.296509 Transcript_102525/m.296509 type:complete len:338 (+) Transcript_102525:503-1516(+)